ncbi:hypothetical protein ARSEF1564_003445 [Beauveria bassiana]
MARDCILLPCLIDDWLTRQFDDVFLGAVSGDQVIREGGIGRGVKPWIGRPGQPYLWHTRCIHDLIPRLMAKAF